MPIDDPNDLDAIDRQIRINELKEEAREISGDKMTAWESDDCPPEIAEQFWQNVVDFEKSPQSTHFVMLAQRGIEVPPPADLSDDQLRDKLWEIINALAEMNVFMCSTDHMSDRELYEHLWSDTLHEWTLESPMPGMTSCLDLVSSGSEEDIQNWHRYYADDDSRAHWKESFPDDVLPPREKPPYDRDSKLPKGERD